MYLSISTILYSLPSSPREPHSYLCAIARIPITPEVCVYSRIQATAFSRWPRFESSPNCSCVSSVAGRDPQVATYVVERVTRRRRERVCAWYRARESGADGFPSRRRRRDTLWRCGLLMSSRPGHGCTAKIGNPATTWSSTALDTRTRVCRSPNGCCLLPDTLADEYGNAGELALSGTSVSRRVLSSMLSVASALS